MNEDKTVLLLERMHNHIKNMVADIEDTLAEIREYRDDKNTAALRAGFLKENNNE